jgi:hypothetical protein
VFLTRANRSTLHFETLVLMPYAKRDRNEEGIPLAAACLNAVSQVCHGSEGKVLRSASKQDPSEWQAGITMDCSSDRQSCIRYGSFDHS